MNDFTKTRGFYSSESDVMTSGLYSSSQPGISFKGEIEKTIAYMGIHVTGRFSGASSCIPSHIPVTFISPSILGQKNLEIAELKQTISELKYRLSILESRHKQYPINVRVVEIQDKPIDKIYELVLHYYNTHDVCYPDEVADDLNLDLRKVIEVVDRLIAEGKIEVAT